MTDRTDHTGPLAPGQASLEQRSDDAETRGRGRGQPDLHGIGLLLVLSAATALRFHALGQSVVWVDEATSYFIASDSLAGIIAQLHDDASPPLYFVLLHFWMELWGTSEWALRSLSALCGVALVGGIYLVGRHWFGRAVGLWAALITAVAPTPIFFSQQARMYTLMPLWALASTHLLGRVLTSPGRSTRHKIGYVLSTAAALLTHNYALFMLPAHGLLLLGSGQLVRRLRTWLALAGGVVLLYSPWLPVFWRQLTADDTYAWFASRWEGFGPLEPLIRTLGVLSPEARKLGYFGYQGVDLWGATALLMAGLAGLGLYRAVRTRSRDGRTSLPRTALAVAICLTAPPTAGLIVSWLLTPCYVACRVTQLFFAAFALLVALGLNALRPAWLGPALAMILLGVGGTSVLSNQPLSSPDPTARDERYLTEIISKNFKGGDVVLATGIATPGVAYYLRRLRPRPSVTIFPIYRAELLADWGPALMKKHDASLKRQVRLLLHKLAGSVAPGSRIFAVFMDQPRADVLDQALRSQPWLREVRPRVEARQACTDLVIGLRVFGLTAEIADR